jgi:hypothetical protein
VLLKGSIDRCDGEEVDTQFFREDEGLDRLRLTKLAVNQLFTMYLPERHSLAGRVRLLMVADRA